MWRRFKVGAWTSRDRLYFTRSANSVPRNCGLRGQDRSGSYSDLRNRGAGRPHAPGLSNTRLYVRLMRSQRLDLGPA